MSTVVVLVSHPVGQGTRNVVVRVNVILDLAGSEFALGHEPQVGSEETVVLTVLFSQTDHVYAGSVEGVVVTLLASQADQVCAGSTYDEVLDVVGSQTDHVCTELLEDGVVAVLFSQADQVFAVSAEEDDFAVLDDHFSQSLVAGSVVVVVDFSFIGQLDQCDSTLDETIVELVRPTELEEGVVYRLVVEIELVRTPGRDDLEKPEREDVELIELE